MPGRPSAAERAAYYTPRVPPAAPLYPLSLKLSGREAVVVGAGTVAERKVRELLAAGALVKVVAPLATPALRRLAELGALVWHTRPFAGRPDIEGSWLAVAATRDPDPAVARQAGESLKEMVFPHAFDPLARLVRESDDPNARFSALTALAQIETPAAAEVLLGVIDHGSPTDREAVRKLLQEKASRAFLDLARNMYRTAPEDLQRVLRDVLAKRGGL